MSVTELTWREPSSPPSPAGEEVEIATALRARPGEWAVIRTYYSKNDAEAYRLRFLRLAPGRRDRYQVHIEQVDNWLVFARYLGLALEESAGRLSVTEKARLADAPQPTFGEMIKRRRLARGLSMDKIAKLAGIATRTYYNAEAAKRSPSMLTRAAIIRALDETMPAERSF